MNNAPRQDDIAYKKPITTTKARPNYFGLYLSFQILAIQSRSAHRDSSLTHSRKGTARGNSPRIAHGLGAFLLREAKVLRCFELVWRICRQRVFMQRAHVRVGRGGILLVGKVENKQASKACCCK